MDPEILQQSVVAANKWYHHRAAEPTPRRPSALWLLGASALASYIEDPAAIGFGGKVCLTVHTSIFG